MSPSLKSQSRQHPLLQNPEEVVTLSLASAEPKGLHTNQGSRTSSGAWVWQECDSQRALQFREVHEGAPVGSFKREPGNMRRPAFAEEAAGPVGAWRGLSSRICFCVGELVLVGLSSWGV